MQPIDGRSEDELKRALTPVDGLQKRSLGGVHFESFAGLVRGLDQLGILGRFEFVIDSAVVGVSKPDPAIFQDALRRGSLRSDQAIYVGDYYEVDVVGARSVGMLPVLLDPVRAYGDVDCHVITRLSGVLDLIDEANNGRRPRRP